MRRVPHPQPSSFNPPVYGREKLRSVSFTTQLRPVSLSSNNTQVKQTAHECMLELLTNAGQEGMDIERLARKVTVAVFKKFGCKSFAENVFLELVSQGPFRREGGVVFYVKKEETPTDIGPFVPPSVTQIKMEKVGKPIAPAISQEELDKISRSADQSFECETPSPSSKVRHPLGPAEYMLNRDDGEANNQGNTNIHAERPIENSGSPKKLDTPSKLKDSHTTMTSKCGDENNLGLSTTKPIEELNTETGSEAAKYVLENPDPTRLNMLLDLIVQVIARVAGHPYPIGQLLTEVIKLGEFTTAEIVLAIGSGPFLISELAQVNYIPDLDTASSSRQKKYQTSINIAQTARSN